MSSENYSHPLKPGIALEIHYKNSNATATVHKAGCKHAAESIRPFTGALADDWFEVAPCARAK